MEIDWIHRSSDGSGTLNLCFNALDRHVVHGLRRRAAARRRIRRPTERLRAAARGRRGLRWGAAGVRCRDDGLAVVGDGEEQFVDRGVDVGHLSPHLRLGGRVGVGAVVEQLLGKAHQAATHRVHGVVRQVHREATGAEHADHRIHVGEHRGGRLGARLHHARRPWVAEQRATRRQDPRSDRRLPPELGGGRPIWAITASIMPPSSSSLPATCLYSAMGTTPSSCAIFRMLTASTPSRSARVRPCAGRAPG